MEKANRGKFFLKISVSVASFFAMFISFQKDAKGIPIVFAMYLIANVNWEGALFKSATKMDDQSKILIILETVGFYVYYLTAVLLIVVCVTFLTAFEWNPEKTNDTMEYSIQSEVIAEDGKITYFNIAGNDSEEDSDCLPERSFFLSHDSLYCHDYYITAHDLGVIFFSLGGVYFVVELILYRCRSRCEGEGKTSGVSDESFDHQVRES